MLTYRKKDAVMTCLIPKDSPLSEFAHTILKSKYAHKKASGHKESWPEIAHRVAQSVCAPYLDKLTVSKIERLIRERKLMPGGRYLYAAGREYHPINNCFLLRAEDSREGWAELNYRTANALMSGGGVGVDYDPIREEGALVRGLGGFCTGPCSLMQIVNEQGRYIKQGGSRRSALWARLGWKHPDIHKFITLKDWPEWLQKKKKEDFNIPATMDGTNISVGLDDEFFRRILGSLHGGYTDAAPEGVYWATIRHMLQTAEPGFSIDVGPNAGETLRNAPVTGATRVLTREYGYCPVEGVVGLPVTLWTGKQWAKDVVFSRTGIDSPTVEVGMTGGRIIRCEPSHEFLVERYQGKGPRRHLSSVDRVAAKELKPGDTLHLSLPLQRDLVEFDPDSYTMGFLYGDGSFRDGHAEVTLCTSEKKSCLSYLTASPQLSVTVGCRGEYDRLYYSTDHKRFDGRRKDWFPREMFSAPLGSLASFLAGLFDADGNYDAGQHRIRLSSVHPGFLRDVARALETLGVLAHVSKGGPSGYGGRVSSQLVVASEYNETFARIVPTKRIHPDLCGYTPYRKSSVKVLSVIPSDPEDVFCADVKVPEHSFMAEGVIISNCTEVSSSDDSDVCNLASLVLPRFASLEEFEEAVDLATAFLVCGSCYSHLPYAKVEGLRQKNRRLGLGLMGFHEWLLRRGYSYGPNEELATWLAAYSTSTEKAHVWCHQLSVSPSIKTRAIAPNGTIAIVAETTSSIEPIFAVAFRRRYLTGSTWKYQYVVDAAAQRLIEQGVDPDSIEDAYTLAEDVERRVSFQAWVQQFVDHGISSTINLPAWGSSINNESTVKSFGNMLLKYLPNLRGVTCYPDGSRGGQPLKHVKYTTAVRHVGKEYEASHEEDADFQIEEYSAEVGCPGGTCGT